MIIMILFQILLFILVLYAIFFKEYFKKKGANLADKEDIQNITEKIESVKKVFTDDSEKLKTTLKLLSEKQLQINNDQKDAIITFFDSYSKWINVGLLQIKVNMYFRNTIDNLRQREDLIDSLYTETTMKQSRLILLVDNEEIVKLSHNLMITTLEFNNWVKTILIKLRLNLEADKSNFELFMMFKDEKPIPDIVKKAAEKEAELKTERKEITSEYYSKHGEEYKKVVAASYKFTEKVKEVFVTSNKI